MDGGAVRNFKDFMLLYNITTETCFGQCVNNFNSRKLYNDEVSCAESCAGKYINFLNKQMGCYVNVQQDMVMRRIAEANVAESSNARAPLDSQK